MLILWPRSVQNTELVLSFFSLFGLVFAFPISLLSCSLEYICINFLLNVTLLIISLTPGADSNTLQTHHLSFPVLMTRLCWMYSCFHFCCDFALDCPWLTSCHSQVRPTISSLVKSMWWAEKTVTSFYPTTSPSAGPTLSSLRLTRWEEGCNMT